MSYYACQHEHTVHYYCKKLYDAFSFIVLQYLE